MKLNLTIKYTNGEVETYTAGLPEWAKWERKTGKSIYKMTDISNYQQTDFLFLAHSAYVRAAAGKPVKAYDVWELTVDELIIGDSEDPKATQPEASTGS
ncbi:MAG: hypothetical protein ACO3QZ_05690 [Candidatus Nanopelagicaceae bacterium]